MQPPTVVSPLARSSSPTQSFKSFFRSVSQTFKDEAHLMRKSLFGSNHSTDSNESPIRTRSATWTPSSNPADLPDRKPAVKTTHRERILTPPVPYYIDTDSNSFTNSRLCLGKNSLIAQYLRKEIILWKHANTFERINTINTQHFISCIHPCGQDQWIVFFQNSPEVEVWDQYFKKGTLITQVSACFSTTQINQANSLFLEHKDLLILWCSDEVLIHDTQGKKPSLQIQAGKSPITALTTLNNESYLIIKHVHTIELINTTNWTTERTIRLDPKKPSTLQCYDDHLAIDFNRSHIHIINTIGNSIKNRPIRSGSRIIHECFPINSYLVSRTERTINIWNDSLDESSHNIICDDNISKMIALDKKNMLLCLCLRGKIHAYDIESGEHLYCLFDQPTSHSGEPIEFIDYHLSLEQDILVTFTSANTMTVFQVSSTADQAKARYSLNCSPQKVKGFIQPSQTDQLILWYEDSLEFDSWHFSQGLVQTFRLNLSEANRGRSIGHIEDTPHGLIIFDDDNRVMSRFLQPAPEKPAIALAGI